jgi:DNA-binding NtrC family response regulator
MPRMDGLQLLGQIKDRFPRSPGHDGRRRAGKLSAFRFITKQVDFDRLKAQLRRLPTVG